MLTRWMSGMPRSDECADTKLGACLDWAEVRRFLSTLAWASHCESIRPSPFLSRCLELIYISFAILCEMFYEATVIWWSPNGKFWRDALADCKSSLRSRI